MIFIQQSQRRNGQWLIQPGAEMIIELNTWELECREIPDEKLDEVFRLAWDVWDGSATFNGHDLREAYRRIRRQEETKAADDRTNWIRTHAGEYRCEQCLDTGWQMVWTHGGGAWSGGTSGCGCDQAPPAFRAKVRRAAPEWIRGADGSWARPEDVAKYGPPHRKFAYPQQPPE